MRRSWGAVVAGLLLALVSSAVPAGAVTFGAGSLVVPMDVATEGQDDGMLTAYGLVYALLQNGVPVQWTIDPAKVAGGTDFAIGPATVRDVATGAAITVPRAYSGGPFVIDAADAAKALPIVQAWQASVTGANTVVHELVVGSFNATVARTLVAAPRLAILKDGNEAIAFNDLNAAGIPDSLGNAWSAASPDLLTESDVAGATTTSHSDGALFDAASGLPRHCHLSSMHYNATASTEEVVAEVGAWLDTSSLLHLHAQCESTRVFENANAGLFLTYAGIDDDGNSAPATPVNRVPPHPETQLAGAFAADTGSVDSMQAISSGGPSDYKTGVSTLINESGSPLTQRIVQLTGRLDGDAANGRVTYLAGHDYALDLPISTNPQTNGVRLYLNGILDSDCALSVAQLPVAVTASSPATTSGSTITYTLDYSNPGARPAENLTLRAPLPAGATFQSATGGGAETSGVVRWALPALASGANGSVSFTVSVASDGTYDVAGALTFAHLTIQTITSNTASTVRTAATPTPTETATPAETATATETPTPTPTETSTSLAPTPTDTVLPSATPTTSASNSPTPVATSTPFSLCAGGPFTCKDSRVATFTLRNKPDDRKDALAFSWTKGAATTIDELGNPLVDTPYAVCVWDDVAGVPALVMEMNVPAAGMCRKRSCWRFIGRDKGYRYGNADRTPQGIAALAVSRGAAGKAKLVVKGRGVLLPDPAMPFQQSPAITVQVLNGDGACFGATFTTQAKKNTAATLSVKQKQ